MQRIRALRIIATSAAAIGLAALAACDTDPAGENPDRDFIERHAGDNQHERLGAQLPDPLVVRVRNLLDDPQTGVTVAFSCADPGAHVSPPTAVTNAEGLASCTFQLGVNTGLHRIRAATATDTTYFSAWADAILCDEESTEKVCRWPAGRLFIATTGSSLLPGAGSVVLEVNLQLSGPAQVLQTTDLISGISFSSRGELFVAKTNEICKINPSSHELQTFKTGTFNGFVLEPNPGGILVAHWQNGTIRVGCVDSEYIVDTHIYPNIDGDCVAVDPVTRDLYLVTVSSPVQYTLWHFGWDGRTTPEEHEVRAVLQVGASDPAGMCIDSTGTVYVVFDGNDNYRRIVKVGPDGSIDYDFFDFYAHAGGNAQEAGRWGDIAYLNGRLYLIDKRNDRLVTISKSGEWLGEMKNTAFSRPLEESEHYSICASPTWLCVGAAEPESRGPSRR